MLDPKWCSPRRLHQVHSPRKHQDLHLNGVVNWILKYTRCDNEFPGMILLQTYLSTYSSLRGVTFEVFPSSSYTLSSKMHWSCLVPGEYSHGVTTELEEVIHPQASCILNKSNTNYRIWISFFSTSRLFICHQNKSTGRSVYGMPELFELTLNLSRTWTNKLV